MQLARAPLLPEAASFMLVKAESAKQTTGTATLNSGGAILSAGAANTISGSIVALTPAGWIGSAVTSVHVATAALSTITTGAGSKTYVSDSAAVTSLEVATNQGDVSVSFLGGSLTFNQGTSVLNESGAGTAPVTFANTGGDVEIGVISSTGTVSITASGQSRIPPASP